MSDAKNELLKTITQSITYVSQKHPDMTFAEVVGVLETVRSWILADARDSVRTAAKSVAALKLTDHEWPDRGGAALGEYFERAGPGSFTGGGLPARRRRATPAYDRG